MATQVSSMEVSGHSSLSESKTTRFANAKYLGILAGLIAVGYYGHQTHWSFGNAKSHDDVQHAVVVQSPDATERPDGDEWAITFPSASSLSRSGIKTMQLEQRPMSERVKTTGVISYDERKTASLSPRASGAVWRVAKQVGDPVHKGDVLVIVNAAEVGKAKADFLQELVSVETSAEILETLESVTGAVPGRQIREAKVAVREASIRLQNAEQVLVNLGLSVRKEDYQKLNDAERAAKLQLLGLPESFISELDLSKTTSNLLVLTAPFDGVVIRQEVALGEMAVEGKPVVEIADLSRMWLKLDVPKEDASKLALGQRVNFTPDGIDRDLEGTINWISTEMNLQTRTLQIRAEVDNPIISSDNASGHQVRLLRANTFGTGSIVLGESNSAFAIPVSAILHADHQPMVFIRTSELSFERVDVKLGIREGQSIQIESPELNSGIEVVTKGCHVLKSEWILNCVASTSP